MSSRYDPATHKKWYEKNAEKKRAYAIAYYASHKEEKQEWARKYGAENKDKIREKNRKRMYGIDDAAVATMMELQNSCCAICSMKFDFDRKGTKPHIDHDHDTGRVRGLLCQKCNLALAIVEKKDFLESAFKYLGVA
jgi:hypothetical protein